MFDFLVQNIRENLKLLDPSGTSTPMMVWKGIASSLITMHFINTPQQFTAFLCTTTKRSKNQPNPIRPNKNHGVNLILPYSSHTVAFTKVTNSTRCCITINPPRLTLTRRKQNSGEMYKNSRNT